MKREGPKVINVGKKDKKDFDLLREDKSSFFYGREHKEVFLMAMVYGFLNNNSKALGEKHSGGHCRVETLNERDITLIKALAVKKTGSLDVLLYLKEVYSIAEQYAKGGISYLKKDVFSKQHGSYVKRLEELMVELHKKIS
jgi:hypothetical protein